MPVNIKGKQYHTVAERIILLSDFIQKQEKQYSIQTELISYYL